MTITGNTIDIEKADEEPKNVAKATPVVVEEKARSDPRATPIISFNEVVKPTERESSLCCGCCCDLVSAVVVVDVLFILAQSINLVLTPYVIYPLVDYGDAKREYYDSAEVGADLDFDLEESDFSVNTIEWDSEKIVPMALMGVGILFALVGIVGAKTFRKLPVMLTAMWYGYYIVNNAITLNLFGIIIPALFLYPHIHLFVALHKGTIRSDNYRETEKNCCN